MALTPGTRIGAYDVIGAIGAGGMGEVYRARDTRLNRDVAIKVLPGSVASDREHLARFSREATVLASLNHPNIAQIYDFEQVHPADAGHHALIMELVDGDDLSRTLAAGPLPLDRVTGIALQIVDALAAAHERGIVHRDLKPANIKLRRDGLVKVLDFGLAKPAAARANDDATMTRRDLTEAGVVLGTPAYMSPEQIAGDAVDGRTDVWSFGCVLFEMLSGRKAFAGNTGAERLSAVLTMEPEWSAIAGAPQNLQALARRCLQKDRSRRLGSIADARMWLEDTAAAPPSTRPRASAASRWIAVAASLMAIAAIAVALWSWRAPDTAPRQMLRLQIAFAEPHLLTGRPTGSNFALSPDGRVLVYHALSLDSFQLVRRQLDGVDVVPINGTDRGQNPAFSPDGKRLAFYSRGAIRTVPVGGGAPTLVCEVHGSAPMITWTDDGFIWFGRIGGPALFRVAETGGSPSLVAEPDASKGEARFWGLAPMPGARVITIIQPKAGAAARSRLVAISATGVVKTLVDDAAGFGGRYGGGHLVFQQGRAVLAAPFDRERLEITGEAFAVSPQPANQLAVSGDGTIVYLQSGVTGASALFNVNLVTHDGRVERTVSNDALLGRHVRASPDGHSLIVVQGGLNAGQIWRHALRSQARPIKIAEGPGSGFPIWRPDGRELVFQALSESGPALFAIASDGSATQPTRLLEGDDVIPEDWTAEGASLMYQTTTAQTGTDLMLLDRATGATRPWLQTPANEAEARIAPGGRWVAYVSDQTGRAEVWVRAFDGSGAPVRVSADGGHEPRWSPGGRTIYFASGTRMMAAELTTTPAAVVSSPRQLFDGGFIPYNSTYRRTFDVTADERFVVVHTDAVEPNQPLVVLLNAFGARQ